jgi:peptidoglycan LD-endopeptidase LytH
MKLKECLIKNRDRFTEVCEGIRTKPCILLNLTKENQELQKVDIPDPVQFEAYVLGLQKKHGVLFSIGKYDENRTIYDHSMVYAGSERRSLHMGMDLWMPENTPVFAPYPGRVHSFRNNDAIGDYGPTIFLEHHLDDIRFYTLYGHLTAESLETLQVGQEIKQGSRFCDIGGYPVNGNWVPHLHFQIVSDLGAYVGDFPGVCKQSDRETFLKNCPHPNLILQIPLVEEN